MKEKAQWIGRAAIVALMLSGPVRAVDRGPISIHTETFPRPPYSQATYYIYERDGAVICTKLAVCDKYDACDVDYHAGAFQAREDAGAGKPYGESPAVIIAKANLRKHQCLKKFVPDIL